MENMHKNCMKMEHVVLEICSRTDTRRSQYLHPYSGKGDVETVNESVPIQLAQCWFPGLVIFFQCENINIFLK